MNKFWVVALETYKRNVKSVTFLVMLLAPLLIIGIGALSGFIGSKMGEADEIAVVSDNEVIRQAFLEQSDLTIVEKFDTEPEAEQALKDDKIGGYLAIAIDEETQKLTGSYIGTSAMGTTDKMMTTQILSSIQMSFISQELGLTGDDLQKLLTPADLSEKTVKVEDGKITEAKGNQLAMMIVSMLVSVAMFMIITLYSQIVAQEVASEKGTRIMEIILSSTKASKHFYGKMMGILMVILTQLIAYVLAFVAAFPLVKNLDIVKDFLKVVPLKDLAKSLLGYNMLFLLLGVMIYTIAAAFSGSLVSKAEDASKAVVPVSYLSMAGYFLTIFLGMNSPNHLLFRISSFIPFLSSYTMPQRIASGGVKDTEVIISLVILAVSVVLLLKLSATLYKSTALVYSDAGMWKTLRQSIGNNHTNKAD
ncbi:ABC transporter permease [Vagococcus elongatus]|uniref:ABC-2 type transporter transmembrane domain-containing protein n=1 Tax=Vagococcus elongatus TaxID=180344 RepID=A0A430AQX4_9ENTE|nr:ABC transporter permease [Vagococcus elongatus]RSU10531.1 hypothetical protein CBF29_09570 [Vagococcus elongatus]